MAKKKAKKVDTTTGSPDKKEPEEKTKVEAKSKDTLCPSCLMKDEKVVMTQRSPMELECPKCNCWMPKPGYKETKADEVARLKARISVLEEK